MSNRFQVAIGKEWLLRLLKAIDGGHSKYEIPEDAIVTGVTYRGDVESIILNMQTDEGTHVPEDYLLSCKAMYNK